MCKQNKKARIIAAIILYVFLIMLTFLNGLDRFADYNQKDLFLGQPLVYKDAAENIYSSITQVLTYDDHLYVVFGYSSIIQVFNSEGQYRYTLQIYNHQNGCCRIVKYGDKLVIKDKRENIYLYRNDRFLCYSDYSSISQNIKELDFSTQSSDCFIRWGSIWKRTGNTDECIVQRPIWLMIYQNGIGTILMFVLILSIGLLVGAFKKRKT